MNKPLFAERFKSARLRNGLSLQDLADLLEGRISRQALHRYEKGEVLPDAEMIKLLSDKFDVSPDYFARATKVELGNIEFRKLSRIPVKEEQKIVELTRDYLSRYLEIEEILGLSADFKNQLSNFNIISNYEQINTAAGELRKEWKLGCDPIYNVAELLEDNQIKVVEINADVAFDGLQTWVNETIPVVAYNGFKLHKPDRIRFTLLHETAHLLLKFNKDLNYKQIETLCHQFASAMLLPDSTLKKELGEHRNRISLKELGNIKQQYGISMQAVIMRAKDCGIINENYTRQFFFAFTHNNWRENEPVDYIGLEKSNRFEQLIHRALAEEQISLAKASSLFGKEIQKTANLNLLP